MKMSLEDSLNKIRGFILARYQDNLAAILIFGSANTGHFREGKSDIDTILLLKRQQNINFNKEIKFLLEALKSEHFATQYFYTLIGIKKHIRERGSWSTYITIVSEDGSKVLYSTPEFEKTRKWLEDNPPTAEAIKKYLHEKDKFELDGYFEDIKNFELTKGFLGHFRRKLQIINYFSRGVLIFDYNTCLNNIRLSKEEKERLKRLYNAYLERKGLSDEEVQNYDDFAKKLTTKISKEFL